MKLVHLVHELEVRGVELRVIDGKIVASPAPLLTEGEVTLMRLARAELEAETLAWIEECGPWFR